MWKFLVHGWKVVFVVAEIFVLVDVEVVVVDSEN